MNGTRQTKEDDWDDALLAQPRLATKRDNNNAPRSSPCHAIGKSGALLCSSSVSANEDKRHFSFSTRQDIESQRDLQKQHKEMPNRFERNANCAFNAECKAAAQSLRFAFAAQRFLHAFYATLSSSHFTLFFG